LMSVTTDVTANRNRLAALIASMRPSAVVAVGANKAFLLRRSPRSVVLDDPAQAPVDPPRTHGGGEGFPVFDKPPDTRRVVEARECRRA
jgi:hypothetical protein